MAIMALNKADCSVKIFYKRNLILVDLFMLDVELDIKQNEYSTHAIENAPNRIQTSQHTNVCGHLWSQLDQQCLQVATRKGRSA